MKRRRLKAEGRLRCCLSCVAIALCISMMQAQESEGIVLQSSERIFGNLLGMEAGYLALSPIEGEGNVSRRFAPESISRILFADTQIAKQAEVFHDEGNQVRAIPLLEQVVRKRSPYMEFLSVEDAQYFALLARAYLLAGRAEDGLRRIKLWRGKIAHDTVKTKLSEIAMEAAWFALRYGEAILLAEEWMNEQRSAADTAIAWRILAQARLREGEPEAALWIALQPIAFSYPPRARHLDYCYAVAALAATRINDLAHAQTLQAEMERLNLDWPLELPSLADASKGLKSKPEPSSMDIAIIPFERIPKLLGQP